MTIILECTARSRLGQVPLAIMADSCTSYVSENYSNRGRNVPYLMCWIFTEEHVINTVIVYVP